MGKALDEEAEREREGQDKLGDAATAGVEACSVLVMRSWLVLAYVLIPHRQIITGDREDVECARMT